MSFKDLSGDQARRTIDCEQVFLAYRAMRAEFDRRLTGSMSWKTVRGSEYPYRKQGGF